MHHSAPFPAPLPRCLIVVEDYDSAAVPCGLEAQNPPDWEIKAGTTDNDFFAALGFLQAGRAGRDFLQ